ncbi:MAG: type II secretion system protein N [Parasphingorhabdus sp.]
MKRFVFFILIFFGIAAAMLFFMPMRLVVSMAGLEENSFSAKQISGSVWDGHIESAQLGPVKLGSLDAGMQFWPLFAGDLILDVERPENAAGGSLNATLGRAGEGFLVADANAKIPVGRQLAPLPASNIELSGFSANFVQGRCTNASGQVRMSLDANIPGLDLQRGLLGNAECQDGVLVLPMASGSGMEKLTLKLEGDGRYSARLALSGGNAAWTLLLPSLGFRKTPDGYAIKMNGQLGQGLNQ